VLGDACKAHSSPPPPHTQTQSPHVPQACAW
jgi:hypothetical protein